MNGFDIAKDAISTTEEIIVDYALALAFPIIGTLAAVGWILSLVSCSDFMEKVRP